jgi:hypothetical protein
MEIGVQSITFPNGTGAWFGFEMYDSQAVAGDYLFDGRSVDGFGAVVSGQQGKAGLLTYGINEQSYYFYNLSDYGTITSLGVEITATQVILRINGQARLVFSAAIPARQPMNMDTLLLVAAGTGLTVDYDDICQSSQAILQNKSFVPKIGSPVRRKEAAAMHNAETKAIIIPMSSR